MMKKYWNAIIGIFLFIAFLGGIILVLQANTAEQAKAIEEAKSKTEVSVKTFKAFKKELKQGLMATGILEASQTLNLLSETEGRVNKIYFELNDFVSAGRVLAETEADIKNTQLKIAQLNYEKAKRDFERYEGLYKNNNLSEYEYENAKFQLENAAQQLAIAQKQVEYTLLKSPISGNIIKKHIGLGDLLDIGTPIATIANIQNLSLKVNIAPQDLDKIQVGQVVKINIPSRNLKDLSGSIKSIGVQSTEAGSYPIEISIPNNASNPLLAGLSAQVFFDKEASSSSLLIPRIALMGDQNQWAVFILQKGKAIWKKVDIGIEYEEYIQILAGVEEGDEVIVQGQQNIKDQQEIQVQP